MATQIENAKQFGTAIRSARRRLHYTQIDLAGLSRTGERFIVELEKGKPTIELDKALHVARMLGLRVTIEVD